MLARSRRIVKPTRNPIEDMQILSAPAPRHSTATACFVASRGIVSLRPIGKGTLYAAPRRDEDEGRCLGCQRDGAP